MNEDSPTPFDTVGDEPVEARIVAWVLGEASAFEAAELERLCEERPELLVFRHRMRALHGLLTEAEAAEADESWKLPPEKRKVLDEIFGEEKITRPDPQKETRIRHSGRRALLAIAACLVVTAIIAGLSAPMALRQRKRAEGVAPRSADFMASSRSVGNPEVALQEMKEAVREQEDKVEEKRKALSTIVRTKGIIYKGEDALNGQPEVNEDQDARDAVGVMKNDTRESAIKLSLDAQDYVAAKREFESNQQVLQQLKLKQIEQEIALKVAKKEQLADGADGFAPSQPETANTPPSAKSETTYNLAARTSDRQAGAKEVARQSQIARQPKGNVELRASAAPAPAAELAAPDSMPELPAMAGAGEGAALGGSGGALGMAADPFLEQPATPAPAEGASGPPAPSLQPLARNSESTTRARAAGRDAMSRFNERLEAGSNKPSDAPMASTGTASASIPADDAVVNGLADSLGARAGKPEADRPPVLFGKDSGAPRQQATQAPAAEREIAGSKSEVSPEKAETAPRLRKDVTSENAPAVFAGVEVSKLSESDKATRAELRSRVDAAWELPVPKDQEPELVLKDKYWDSSFVEKPREKDRSGGTEYELHTGFSSEYLFRGMDLNPKDRSKPAAADLAELMEEIPAAENPYSTFSLNISDASFQLAKAALAKGERPDPASIKPEQFYNAVDYGDPAPMSNEPVAATIEQSAHPVIPGRNLVRVALRTGSTGRSAAQPLRLTLLVDQSGSMVREDRRASMDHALAQLGVLLTKNDQVTVIGFSRTPHLLAEALTGDEAGKLGELVNQTASEGGTNLEEALRLGAEKAASHKLAGAQNRVVLFTDGAANLGDADPARLAEQVKSLRQKGIAFDVAGIGADGLNDRLLSDMARNGNGRYYIVGDEKNDSFARQLAGAFRPAAENVKVQVNFNPRRVGKYRLLGFEKDRLKTEDFRNDAVDAAELAAEEAGVAIYQVEPLADGTGELGEVSVRFRDAAGGEMVERSWTISYDAQASAFDRATPSMQLAGLSLLAAEKLRGGPLGDAIDFKQHAGSAASVKQFYGSSPRVADMLQVIEKLK